ncbi:MAG TPA: MalY/PatB family protein [Anaerolineaceae bacterium]|nr:MalY/PatB family protein [Anaerolineaceae bacterium]
MSYNFDDLPDRRSTESIKWHYFDEDVLPMWVADMDFVSPKPVVRALHQRVEHGVFGYPCDMPELIQVIVDRMAERYGWQVLPEQVVLIPGVVTGFNLVERAIAAPGEGVLIQTPVYPPFLSAPTSAGLLRQEMELTRGQDGRYSIDYDAFETAITDQTRLFILCNPHNPIGRVFRPDELEHMAEICLRHQVVICSDEIHSDLIFSGQRHVPIAALQPEIAQNSLTLIAPSKTFNIAGLSCSAAIIQNPRLREKLQSVRHGLVGSVNLLGQIAGLAAYRDGQPWLDELLVYLEANRDFLFDFVNNELPGISMAKPEGTYLGWLDCRQANITGNPCEFFIKQARVAMNDGVTFGRGGAGFLRLNFGCPRSMLGEALERMKKALANRN